MILETEDGGVIKITLGRSQGDSRDVAHGLAIFHQHVHHGTHTWLGKVAANKCALKATLTSELATI